MQKTKRILWIAAALAAVLAVAVAGCKQDDEDEWMPVTIRNAVLEKYAGERTTVTIPDGVTGIGSKAFSGSDVTAVIIPAGVKTIAPDAFEDSEVKSVSFIVTDELPGDEQTEALRKAGIKVSCFIIDGKGMLTGYEGNETEVVIPAGYVKGIADGVFQNCAVHTKITDVTIPGSVKRVGANAFADCTALAVVRIEAGVAYIGDGAFARCTALTSMVIPAGVTELGGGISTGCTNLTELRIHESVTTIASGALTGTEGLKDVHYSGRKAQWEKVVAGKEQYFAGKTVHCADGEVWRYVPGQGTITPGDGTGDHTHTWTYINDGERGHYQACECGERSETEEHVYDGTDPECNTCGYRKANSGDPDCEHTFTVEHTENGHYRKCSRCGKEVDFENHHYDGAPYKSDGARTHSRTCTTTGCGYTETEAHSLGECESDGKGGHQKTCTAGCGYSEPVSHVWSDKYTADSDKHYKPCTIDGCTARNGEGTHNYDDAPYKDDSKGGHYRECTVCKHPSDSVDHEYEREYKYEKIDSGNHRVTCAGCGYFFDETHKYDDDTTDTDCNKCGYKRILKGPLQIEGGTLTIDENGKVTDYKADVPDKKVNVVIPDGVTGIDGNAFQGHWELETVVIPGSVEDIGANAFANSGIQSVTLDGVKNIGQDAFKDCHQLTEVTIADGMETIGSGAFQNCSRLETVTIPGSVTSIGADAFQNCGNLDTVVIGNNVKNIGSGAFSGCGSLTSMTIPGSVNNIGNGAFQNCGELVTVVIKDGVTAIAADMFEGCHKLETVSIPDSVTAIGNGAFENCSTLYGVNIPDKVKSIGDRAFKDCYGLTEIAIPVSVTSIGTDAFSGALVNTITYAGTQAQWEAITGDGKDIGLTSNVTITCSDGELP
ncbi:MAG: leucine-rich repeat domain-containing protein [Treponema sp.]|nr:leucine-rich repeat domain-containing protein [Treponema sp.]